MPVSIQRRSLLLGALGGVSVGATAGIAAARLPESAIGRKGAARDAADKRSYAQVCEDLIVADIFKRLHVDNPTYLDIGAHDPIVWSNTYLFYEAGSRGVLVEPNPSLTGKLRRVRPGDTVLEVGIGAKGADVEADYYLVAGKGEMNTFSQEEAKHLQAEFGADVVVGVIKRKLVDVNRVLAENFPNRAPDFVSTDTEGYDFTILSGFDFERFRPRVFCVETLASSRPDARIVDLMQSRDYEIRGGTFVNTVFVDRR
jgi:FkbM family methyltransferase